MVLRETKKFQTKDGQNRKFYGCLRWPECNGVIGAHPDGKPLGFAADDETKLLRREAHKLLSKWYGNDNKSIYIFLKNNTVSGHIGMTGKDELKELIKKLKQ